MTDGGPPLGPIQPLARAKNVVIVAARSDAHALSVKYHVERLGTPCDIVDSQSMSSGLLTASLPEQPDVQISDCRPITSRTAVWWRRARPPAAPPLTHDEESARFTRAEWKASLYSFVGAGVGNVINDPFAEHRANHKIVQLRLAKFAGLPIPRTIVTNDLAEAERFLQYNRSLGHRSIFKPLTPPMNQLGEARVITDTSALRDGLHLSPLILQSCVERGIDIRVVVVGDEIFGGSIAFTGDFEDWRIASSPEYRIYRVEPSLNQRILRLMQSLGLTSGSIDLRIDRAGVPHFLEVNPSGQFLFLELELDLPISVAFATVLTGGSRAST